MDLGLKGKVALIAGGSQGLGRAVALEMAREGAAMAICHRNSSEQADEVAGQVREFGVPCLVLQADVSSAGDVSRLFDAVRSEYGRLDVLVNNAGTSQPKTILEMTEEDWDFIIDTNLKSTFLCCRAAVPIMRDLGGRPHWGKRHFRTAADLAGRVRIGGATYLGNHGVERGHLPRRARAEALHIELARLPPHFAALAEAMAVNVETAMLGVAKPPA